MSESIKTPAGEKYYLVTTVDEVPDKGTMLVEGKGVTFTKNPDGSVDAVSLTTGGPSVIRFSPEQFAQYIKNGRIEIPTDSRATSKEKTTDGFNDFEIDDTPIDEEDEEESPAAPKTPELQESLEADHTKMSERTIAIKEELEKAILEKGGKIPTGADIQPKKEAEKLPEMNLDQAKATFLGKIVEFRNKEASERAKTLYETNAKEAAKIKVVSKEKVADVIEKDGELFLVSESGLEMPLSAILARSVEALNRANKLAGLKEKFLTGMRKDTAKENMGGLQKTWLGIKSAFNIGDSNKMVGGLSKETSEAWGELNGYLDELRSSAKEEWKQKYQEKHGAEIPEDQLVELDRRYVARFLSGLQLQSEYDAMNAEKSERTSTWARSAVAKAKKWWGDVHPGVKMGLGIAAAAGAGLATGGIGAAAMGATMAGGGMGLSALFNKTVRGKGKTVEAWAGFGAAQSMSLGSRVMYGLSGGGSFNLGAAGIVSLSAALARTGLETYSTTKGDAETMNKLNTELKAFNDKAKNLKEAMDTIEKTLASKDAIEASGQTKEQLEARLRKYEAELIDAQNQVAQIEQNFKQAAGRLDNRLKEYTEQYNAGKISASEYIKHMEAARGRDELMETLKQSMTLVALGSAAARIGDHFIGGDDAVVAPDNDPTPGNEDETTPKPLPGPVEPKEFGPEPAPNSAPDTTPTAEGSMTDATVQKGEGITHAFKRQFDHNPDLVKAYEEKLGMDYETNKGAFLAKVAREFGYINDTGDVRVLHGHGAAYQLEVGPNGELSVQEFANGKAVETHAWGSQFETAIDSQEYLHSKGSDSTVLHPDDSTVLHPKDDPSTVLHPEKTPEELAEEAAKKAMQTKIVSFIDNFDDNLKEKLYDKAMSMQAQVLMDDSGFAPDIHDKFWPLRDQLMEIQKETGLNPEPYESVEQYLNRVLAASGATYSVEAIHQDKVFSDVTINPEELADMRYRESYRSFMDKFFDKSGVGKNNWTLEGAPSVDFKDIQDLPARDVFQGIESGKVGPNEIAQQLNVSTAAATRLFDFFQETKKLAEVNLGQFHVDGKMTIGDVLRDALRERKG